MRLRTKYKRLKKQLAVYKNMLAPINLERDRYDCCDLEISKIYDPEIILNIPEGIIMREIADELSKSIVENGLIEYQTSEFRNQLLYSGRVKVLRRKP